MVLLPLGNAVATQPEPANPVPPKRSPAYYLWAVLIARIYEVFPPLWEGCAAQMDDGSKIEPDWDLAAQPAVLNRCWMALRSVHAPHRTSRS